MLLVWDENAWADYLWWQTQDRKTLKRINLLLKDILRNGNEGVGKPEPLKRDFAGYWFRGSPTSIGSSTSSPAPRFASQRAGMTTGSGLAQNTSDSSILTGRVRRPGVRSCDYDSSDTSGNEGP